MKRNHPFNQHSFPAPQDKPLNAKYYPSENYQRNTMPQNELAASEALYEQQNLLAVAFSFIAKLATTFQKSFRDQ